MAVEYTNNHTRTYARRFVLNLDVQQNENYTFKYYKEGEAKVGSGRGPGSFNVMAESWPCNTKVLAPTPVHGCT